VTRAGAAGYDRGCPPFEITVTRSLLFCALAATGLLGGCASTETSTEPSVERVEREYTTGSNIPRKHKAGKADGVSTQDREAFERQRDATPVVPPAGGGAGR
jgi:hypothetical protein